MGTSYGGFGGGRNDTIGNFDDRLDFDASAYWELRNLGFGETAARSSAQSLVQQARLRQMATMDLVAREVAEALAQVESRRPQIELARQAVTAAVDSHRMNITRIQEAQGLPIEALQSIQALLQARREYLRAVIDYNAAQFTLHRALGWPIGPR
jgi:outer membrane protein TolC